MEWEAYEELSSDDGALWELLELLGRDRRQIDVNCDRIREGEQAEVRR